MKIEKQVKDIREVIDKHFRRKNGTYSISRESRYILTQEIFTLINMGS